MGFARTWAVALVGLEGSMVEVEADIGQTLPAFSIVGLPDGEPRLPCEGELDSDQDEDPRLRRSGYCAGPSKVVCCISNEY